MDPLEDGAIAHRLLNTEQLSLRRQKREADLGRAGGQPWAYFLEGFLTVLMGGAIGAALFSAWWLG